MTEQWSEWFDHDGSERPPIGDGVKFNFRMGGLYESTIDYKNASKYSWSDITHYRYKLTIGEQLIESMKEAVSIANPYSDYTTDELLHAVLNMREEMRRRCL